MTPENRISSGGTFFYKRVFPVMWFGFLVVFVAAQFGFGSRAVGYQSLPFFIVPIIMCVFGYFLMKKLIFDLVDEVVDAGDVLIVRNGTREERIALSDITNVNYMSLTSPPRVTLSLRHPGIFGTQITFCAPLRFTPFGVFTPSPVIAKLVDRVDAARRKR